MPQQCSKCKTTDREAGQAWCPGCQAAYMRVYRKTHKTRDLRMARKIGAEEFRAAAVEQFRRIGESTLNGYAAAKILADQLIL
jgi:hypothetical protein